MNTNTDWLAWLWWGTTARKIDLESRKPDAIPPERPGPGDFTFVERPSIHGTVCLALSTYRPHRVITNIATKNVPLPFEARGSEPSYYGMKDNKDQEYLYVNREYAMGTLYTGEKGVKTRGTILPQTTMFKLLVLDTDDVRSFGMSNGYHGHFPLEGRSPYDQYHQKRGAAINVCFVDRDEDERTKHHSLLGVPVGIMDPVEREGWFFWEVKDAFVAARPLNGEAAFGDCPWSVKQREKAAKKGREAKLSHRFLVSPGKLTGWVVQAGQRSEHATFDEFQADVLRRCELDVARFEAERYVRFRTLDGDAIALRHTGGPGGRPDAWTNQRKLVFESWPVYDSPYVREDLRSGILRLSDGEETLTIDFSGERPVYTEGRE